MRRDHGCSSPYCVKTALPTNCPKCGFWFCQLHFATHDCDKIESWQTAAPSLNALKDLDPDSVVVDREKGKATVHLPLTDMVEEPRPKRRKKPGGLGPRREDWKKIIPK